MKPFVIGAIKQGGNAAMLSREDMGRIIEAIRYTAQDHREGTGVAPRALNRIGANLARITESEWIDE